jgi:hypothetical protein
LGLQIAKLIGTPLQDVPFQGAAPMIREPNRRQCRRGKFDGWRLRAAPQGRQASRAGVTSAQRSPLLPDVPTFGELGRKSSPRWAYWPYVCLLDRLLLSSPNGALRSEKPLQPSNLRARSARSALWRREARRLRPEPGSARCVPSGRLSSKLRDSKRTRTVGRGGGR